MQGGIGQDDAIKGEFLAILGANWVLGFLRAKRMGTLVEFKLSHSNALKNACCLAVFRSLNMS